MQFKVKATINPDDLLQLIPLNQRVNMNSETLDNFTSFTEVDIEFDVDKQGNVSDYAAIE